MPTIVDLEEEITLLENGKTVTLPLVNLLRITLIKLAPLFLQYQQEMGKSDIAGCYEWLREKFDMKGNNVLL